MTLSALDMQLKRPEAYGTATRMELMERGLPLGYIRDLVSNSMAALANSRVYCLNSNHYH